MITALLTLAVSLALPATNPVSSGLHADMHTVATQISHDHTPGHGHQSLGWAGVHFGCELCGIGCCMMTFCHPLLAIEPYGVAVKVADQEVETTVAIDVPGNEPDCAVPPPRILPV